LLSEKDKGVQSIFPFANSPFIAQQKAAGFFAPTALMFQLADRDSIAGTHGAGQTAVVGAVVLVPKRMAIADPVGQHFELLA